MCKGKLTADSLAKAAEKALSSAFGITDSPPIGIESLPKASEYGTISPGSQPPTFVSTRFSLKTEVLGKGYHLYNRAQRKDLLTSLNTTEERQKGFTRWIDEGYWELMSKIYKFDCRNMKNFYRYVENVTDHTGEDRMRVLYQLRIKDPEIVHGKVSQYVPKDYTHWPRKILKQREEAAKKAEAEAAQAQPQPQAQTQAESPQSQTPPPEAPKTSPQIKS